MSLAGEHDHENVIPNVNVTKMQLLPFEQGDIDFFLI